jgi:hypothetical protein
MLVDLHDITQNVNACGRVLSMHDSYQVLLVKKLTPRMILKLKSSYKHPLSLRGNVIQIYLVFNALGGVIHKNGWWVVWGAHLPALSLRDKRTYYGVIKGSVNQTSSQTSHLCRHSHLRYFTNHWMPPLHMQPTLTTCKLGKKHDSIRAGLRCPSRGATSRVIRK